MNNKFYIGADIGGTKCAVLLAKTSGTAEKPVILGKKTIKTEGTPAETLEKLFVLVEELLNENGNPATEGIGIACGGPLDAERGVILSPPNLHGWDEVHVCELFSERFGVPARLGNDADAGALAEWKFGAGRGCKNMIFLTFGTGLGAGLILNGRLYRGANGNAGEIGHVRLRPRGPIGYGKEGSAEGFCSGGGIARLAVIRAENNPAALPLLDSVNGDKSAITAKIVAEAAVAGDPFCKAVFNECGEMLGETLAVLADLFNPERIVLGGVFMRSEKLLRPAMEKTLRAEALPASLSVLRVLPAALGESIGDYAALSLATE